MRNFKPANNLYIPKVSDERPAKAFCKGEPYKSGHDLVEVYQDRVEQSYRGNVIAYRSELMNNNVLLTLDDCGWRTMTTKNRMNAILNVFGTGLSIYQKDGDWYVSSRDADVEDIEWEGHLSLYLFKDGKEVYQ